MQFGISIATWLVSRTAFNGCWGVLSSVDGGISFFRIIARHDCIPMGYEVVGYVFWESYSHP